MTNDPPDSSSPYRRANRAANTAENTPDDGPKHEGQQSQDGQEAGGGYRGRPRPPGTILLLGHRAILGAIHGKNRRVDQLLVEAKRSDRDTRHLKAAARDANIPVKFRTREELDKISKDPGHGGAIARCGPRRALDLDGLHEELVSKSLTTPFLVALDGVEDPFNFGYAIRSLYAAGCDAVITRPRNWAQSPAGAGTVARAAAGALDLMTLAITPDLDSVVAWATHHHFKVAAAEAADDAVALEACQLTGPLLLMIGGEKRGLPTRIVQGAHQRIAIPYGRSFEADLSTVAAVSVLAFEARRQRAQS